MNTQIVNLSMPKKLLDLADLVAKSELRSRSELFREAVRSYVLKKKGWDDLFGFSEKQAKRLNIKSADVQNIISDYRRS